MSSTWNQKWVANSLQEKAILEFLALSFSSNKFENSLKADQCIGFARDLAKMAVWIILFASFWRGGRENMKWLWLVAVVVSREN